MPTTLAPEGIRLLEYLVSRASDVDVHNLNTFPNYSGAHQALGLEIIGRTWGDSLDLQGMSVLATWAFENGFPAVTGLIIDKAEKRPGKGFFDLYGKNQDADGAWWLEEVEKAKTFPWPQTQAIEKSTTAIETTRDRMSKSSVHSRSARTIGDLASKDSRFFLKSEWGPISPEWPALSFSKRSVGDYLRREYDPSRDFIVYAGTGNPERTTVVEFRKRLLSILVTEPGQPIPTEELVPWDSWQAAKTEHGKMWPFSFAVREAWGCTALPWASDITPEAYRSLGVQRNWGGVVEILGTERNALLSLEIEWVDLPNRAVVQSVSSQRDQIRDIVGNTSLNSALVRMEALIKGRLGAVRTVRHELPTRILPPGTDLIALLNAKWQSQNSLCALCGQLIELETSKKLLQCSPDRIDSKNPSYGDDNLQITHLACNLAKNDGSAEDFEEWLQLVSGEQNELE